MRWRSQIQTCIFNSSQYIYLRAKIQKSWQASQAKSCLSTALRGLEPVKRQLLCYKLFTMYLWNATHKKEAVNSNYTTSNKLHTNSKFYIKNGKRKYKHINNFTSNSTNINYTNAYDQQEQNYCLNATQKLMCNILKDRQPKYCRKVVITHKNIFSYPEGCNLLHVYIH